VPTTIGDIVTQMRVRLGESTPNEWTDAQLQTYARNAEQWMANFLGKMPFSGRFKYRESFVIPADTTDVALSSLTKRFAGLRNIFMLLPGGYLSDSLTEIDELQENRWTGSTLFTWGGLVVPGYMIRDTNLRFLPKASGTRTIYIVYRWLPALAKASGTNLDTPEDYNDDIVARALHFALADVGEKNTSFEEEYSARLGEIEMIEIARSHESGGERVQARSPITFT